MQIKVSGAYRDMLNVSNGGIFHVFCMKIICYAGATTNLIRERLYEIPVYTIYKVLTGTIPSGSFSSCDSSGILPSDLKT